ncbi:Outer membrane receptor proteins, mostly Fe transport [Dyella sp. OK004]|uniref:TonB-dependent receptor n=1 Tax=Dyella sp. OK004 TaxID=1855292 RepID=UPI0008EC11D7|nr:TonB-dependent receptor [Dyella sp. OK004]SFS11864.1 Outer membrane receptor proteins, mostly Fe transport [Dyella sp. OK004]
MKNHHQRGIRAAMPCLRKRAIGSAIGLAIIGWSSIACAYGMDGLSTGTASAGGDEQQSTGPKTDATKRKSDKVVNLNGVSVTAQTEAQVPPTAAFTESVISAETIRNLSPGPSTTAQTMLNQEPSIFAYTNGPMGVETTIYFRAFNSSQFAETYAGVALNDVFNGGVTNQAENRNNVLITPNNLQSVQLYRGINNPAVNSYNSLGGTVNYIPRQPGDVYGGEVGLSYGSFHTYGWHATLDTGDWNGVKQILSFEQNGSHGWIQNTNDHNNNLYWGLTYAIDDSNHVYNYFLYNNNAGYAPFNMPVALLRQYGNSYQWPKNWTNSYMKDTNWMDVLGWKSQFADNIRFESKLFFGRNEYLRNSYSNPAYQQSDTQPYNLEDTPSGYAFWLNNPNGPTYDPAAVFGTVQDGTAYHFYGYTTEGIGDTSTLTLSLPQNEITVGGNITYGKLHSREYWYGSQPVPQIDGYNNTWDEHDHRTLGSVFAQDEIALLDGKLHITPGVKYIYAKTTNHDVVGIYYPIAGRVKDTEHFLSPTIGLNYEVMEGLNVYGGYGKNFKLPDISAYYGAFQSDASGNPTIVPPKVKPEYVEDFELGARYQIDGFSAALNGYRENFTNTFVTSTDPVTLLSTFKNGGRSRYQGVELQLKQDWDAGAFGGLSLYFNYAHNQAKFTSSFSSDFAGQVTAGQPLAGVPQNLISTGIVWRWNGWRVNADARYVDKQYIDQLFAGTPTASTIKSYAVVNLGVNKTIALDKSGFVKQLKFGLNIDNLFNRRYLNTAFTDTDVNGNSFIRGIVAAPRSVMGSVAVDF